MSQFKLVSVHSLGQGVLWHSLWEGYQHTLAGHCTEDYFVRLFWHFMRFPQGLAAARVVEGGVLRPMWGSGVLSHADESFLLSCHLLYYQDWLLCLMTYLYAHAGAMGVGGLPARGAHNFLWACHSLHGDLVLG